MLTSDVKLKRFIWFAWYNLNRRTINGYCPDWNYAPNYLRRGIELRFTRDEFTHWYLKRRRTVMRMWKAGEVPSIDRINSNGHYEFTNMRLTTLRKNKLEGSHKQRKMATLRCIPHNCLKCGKALTRKALPYGGLEASARFNIRQTCGMQCRIIRKRK